VRRLELPVLLLVMPALSACAPYTTFHTRPSSPASAIHGHARQHEMLVIDEIVLLDRENGDQEDESAVAEWVELAVLAAITDSGRYAKVFGPRAADLAPDGGAHGRLEIRSDYGLHRAGNRLKYMLGAFTLFLAHTVLPLRYDLSQNLVLEIRSAGSDFKRFRSDASATRTCYVQARGALHELFKEVLLVNLDGLSAALRADVPVEHRPESGNTPDVR